MLNTNVTVNIEAIVSASVEALLMRYDLLMEQFGDKPLGYIRGNKWQRLDAYLTQMREDPLVWQQAVQYYQQQYGNLQAAVMQVIKEATAMEKSLALEGGWDRTPDDYARAVQAGAQRVRAEMFSRQIGAAERAMRSVEKMDSLPKPLVGPPLLPEPVPTWALQPAPLPAPGWPEMGQPMVQQMPAPPMGVLQ